MSEHTPGPWHFDAVAPAIVGPDGHVVARVWAIREPAEANARLLAAAPELLMWLEFALRRLRDSTGGLSDHANDEITRVIAKAEGRQP